MRIASILFAMTISVGMGCGNGDDEHTNPDAAVIDAADVDSGGDGDAAIDAPGNTTDAAIGVVCGAETCTASQECCVGGGGAGRTCVTAGTCGGVTFACDGPEDCMTAGDVCCFGAGAGGATCEPSNTCQAAACHQASDCPHANQQCCAVAQTMVCAVNCP